MQNQFEVIIVGSGFSGLMCTQYLKEAGIEDVRIFEMNSSVGGVWSHGGVGSYPGAACDVPSYTYLPFLDRTGFIPSKKYVSQGEIADYAEMLTDHFELRDHIQFSRKVVSVDYIGKGSAAWQVTTVDAQNGEDKQTATCQHVVSANGPLSSPRMPEVPGMETFQGESFHTALWDRSASLKGKKIGVIGTGASAAQVITSIVDDVESLTVIQRTPTWVLPRDDEPTPPEMVEAFKAGGYSKKLRHVDWKGELPVPTDLPFTFEMLQDEEANAKICAGIAKSIAKEVDDAELAKTLTPDYPFFCKRVLFIDDYYATYNRSNVTLVNEPGGVVAINATGLEVASGATYDFDVIIYATGFDSNFIPFPINGRDGASLAERFGAAPENNFQMTKPQSLWGIHVKDMPNMYMMIGPQSLNPVTNVTLLCEEQSRYIATLVAQMKVDQKLEVEPTMNAVEAWTDRCEASSEGKVWLRCNNWYTKSTKSDEQAGRTRSSGMWMENYESYLQHLLGEEGGAPETLLNYS